MAEALSGESEPDRGGTTPSLRNRAPTEEIVPAVLFSPSQIQKVAYSGRLNYVVTQSGNSTKPSNT